MSYIITMSHEELNILRDLISQSNFGQYITIYSVEKGRRLFDVRIDIEYIDKPFNLLANYLIKVGEIKSINKTEYAL
jgi:hypothetical protein